MGPIADRSREFLGSSDAVIVRARRLFFKALDEHADGKLPFGLDQAIDYRAHPRTRHPLSARDRLAPARSQKSAGLRIPPVRRELSASP